MTYSEDALVPLAAVSSMLAGFGKPRTVFDEFVAVKVIVPLNLKMLFRVIVEMPLPPKETVRDEGLAEIPKSGTLTVTLTMTEWWTVPLVPLTLTL